MEAVDQLASAGTFRVVKEPLAFLRVLEWVCRFQFTCTLAQTKTCVEEQGPYLTFSISYFDGHLTPREKLLR
ncbi:hypothetical protein TURU_151288 [Turdus rufiventris]|nr:hypothetical protein TURU_151288 [Turdus rufiventris]